MMTCFAPSPRGSTRASYSWLASEEEICRNAAVRFQTAARGALWRKQSSGRSSTKMMSIHKKGGSRTGGRPAGRPQRVASDEGGSENTLLNMKDVISLDDEEIVNEEENGDLSVFTQSFIDDFVSSAGFKLAKKSKKKTDDDKSAKASANPSGQDTGDHGDTPEVKEKRRKVSSKDMLRFEREGHVVARSLLLPSDVEGLREAVLQVYEDRMLEAYQQKCEVMNLGMPKTIAHAQKMISSLPAEQMPFLQLFNLRKKSTSVNIPEVVSKAAADLLGTKKIRVYQDSLFVKRPGDGPTLWHSDLNIAPLDTNSFVTAWIPFQSVPTHGSSPLQFASRSHRDFAACYWRGKKYLRGADLSERYEVHSHEPLQVGDVTFHHGWTLHGAPGLDLDAETRYAFTVSFFAEEETSLLPSNIRKEVEGEDRMSYESWVQDIKTNSRPLTHKELEPIY